MKIPLPPESFMKLVCGENQENLPEHFRWAGELLVSMLKEEDMLRPGTHFLDVGCGCGRVARYLTGESVGSYTGFDRHPGMINWCQAEIATRIPNFHFHCFDIKSPYTELDGYAGTIEASSFQFPFADRSYDTALLASVFTHIPLEESGHYLKELYRVLKPAGKILLSVFLTDQEPYSENVAFYYHPEAFLSIVRDAGFGYKFREEIYQHNWYVLVKT